MKDIKRFIDNFAFPYLKRRIFGKSSFTKFLAILMIGISLTLGYNLLVEYLQFKSVLPETTIADTIYELPKLKLIIRALIWAPLFEELFFRGLLYMLLRHFIGYKTAAFVSAIAFAVYHMDICQGIYAFLFAFALVGIIRAYLDLFSSVLLHFVANATAIFMTYNGIIEEIMQLDERVILLTMVSSILFGNLFIIIIILRKYRYLFDSDFTG